MKSPPAHRHLTLSYAYMTTTTAGTNFEDLEAHRRLTAVRSAGQLGQIAPGFWPWSVLTSCDCFAVAELDTPFETIRPRHAVHRAYVVSDKVGPSH